jgi:choline dehydrogenase-like flavoprotein
MAMFSFHQMGTARMGDRRDRDVVNPEGQLWSVPGLHVADASLFPEASGVNPQVTVYGLADVVGEAIATS